MGKTMVEKILAKQTGIENLKIGDVVEPKVGLAMSHENGSLVVNQFYEIYKELDMESK
jgi:homoaconitase/3-isopropylmalate dehydratase large subunit